MDVLRDLWGPGLVFLVLCVWLVRKVVKAARTESELEGDRLAGALAEELQRGRDTARASQRPQLQAVPPPEDAPLAPVVPIAAPAASAPRALGGADTTGALAGHLEVVAALVEQREAALLALAPHSTPRRLEVLWVRSSANHVAWCERRHPALAEARPVREEICVARIQDGKPAECWSFD